MKKALLLVVALAVGGAAFAQNKTKGVDVHLGLPYGFTTLSGTVDGVDSMKESDNAKNPTIDKTMDWHEFGVQIKAASYNGFWVNDIIGIYASVGINFGGVFNPNQTYKHAMLDTEAAKNSMGYTDKILDKGNFFGVSGEFMVGPSFGVNLGEIRFQSGLAFHAIVGGAWKTESIDAKDMSNPFFARYIDGKVNTKHQLTTASVGLALTPQVRFGASKKLSLVVGADIVFDFPVLAKYKSTMELDSDAKATVAGVPKSEIEEGLKKNFSKDEDMKIDSSFRFGFTPYVGLGFNF